MCHSSRRSETIERAESAPHDPTVRVSDAERDATADLLRRHCAAGRLSAEELEERLEHAFAARTAGDLEAVKADLPRDAGRSPAERAERRRRRFRAELRTYARINLVLIAIWALAGFGGFWPAWVILGWGTALVLKSRHRTGGPLLLR
jgi:hypothetical protein